MFGVFGVSLKTLFVCGTGEHFKLVPQSKLMHSIKVYPFTVEIECCPLRFIFNEETLSERIVGRSGETGVDQR